MQQFCLDSFCFYLFNLFTPEAKQFFLQTDIPAIIPSNAKQTGSSQNNVKDLAEHSLSIKEKEPNGVKSFVAENKVKFEALKIDNTIEESSVISSGKTMDTSTEVTILFQKNLVRTLKVMLTDP